MTEIYFIPGLGADARLFHKQKLAGIPFTVLEWIKPLKNEPISSYAARLSEGISDKKNSILVGVSLGGIMAQEIAKIHPIKKVIIISSAKTSHEIPFYFRMFRYFPVHRFIPGRHFRRVGKMARRLLGGTNPAETLQIGQMIEESDPEFMQWAIHRVIHWRFPEPLGNVLHLHGTGDVMFPAPLLRKKNVSFLKGGSHIMVYTRAAEVNSFLKKELGLE